MYLAPHNRPTTNVVSLLYESKKESVPMHKCPTPGRHLRMNKERSEEEER